jgi:hypothetical protein
MSNHRCNSSCWKASIFSYILQNLTVHGKKLQFTVATPFNLVLELADCPKWLHTLDAIRTDWFNGGRGEMRVMAMVSRGMFGDGVEEFLANGIFRSRQL